MLKKLHSPPVLTPDWKKAAEIGSWKYEPEGEKIVFKDSITLKIEDRKLKEYFLCVLQRVPAPASRRDLARELRTALGTAMPVTLLKPALDELFGLTKK